MAQELQSLGGDVFQTLRTEIDRLLTQFAGGSLSPLGSPSSRTHHTQTASFTPPAEVTEDETSYRIVSEFPGIDQKDIEVNVTGSLLTIRADRRQEQEQKGRNYLVRERSYGTLRREFRIPDDVDRNRITAESRNGVLTLTLPRSQESRDQRRRIEIRSS